MNAKEWHLLLTFAIAFIGILAVCGVYSVAVWRFESETNPAETIVAVVGSATTVIGTLVGAVAGHSAGAAGRDKAEQDAEKARTEAGKATELSIGLQGWLAGQGDILTRARQELPTLFPPP